MEVEPAVGGLTEHTTEVGVLDDEDSPGSDRVPHGPENVSRTTEMLEKEPAVDEVVRGRLVPVVYIHHPKVDIRTTLHRGRLSRHRELHLVHVDPDHATARTGPPGDLECHLAATASEVETAHGGTYTYPVEEDRGMRQPGPGKNSQPLVTIASTADYISFHADEPIATAGAVIVKRHARDLANATRLGDEHAETMLTAFRS